VFEAAKAAVRVQRVFSSAEVQDGQGVLHGPAGGRRGKAAVRGGQKQTPNKGGRTGGAGPDGDAADPERAAADTHLRGAWRRTAGKPEDAVQLHRYRTAECGKPGSATKGRIPTEAEEERGFGGIPEPEVPARQDI